MHPHALMSHLLQICSVLWQLLIANSFRALLARRVEAAFLFILSVFLIAGYEWEAAVHLFSNMPCQKIRPDRMTFTTCITALGKASLWQESLRLFGQMQLDMTADLVSMSSVINACGNGMNWQLSLILLDDLKIYDLRPNVTTYGAAIAACESGSAWSRAVELLGRMQRDQCTPNAIVIGAALAACQTSMQVSQAAKLMQKFRLSPTTKLSGRSFADSLEGGCLQQGTDLE